MYIADMGYMKTYSMDLRERVLVAYDAREGTQKELASRFRVSVGWIRKLLRRRRETGSYEAWDDHAGRKAAFEGKALEQLREWVQADPDIALQELRDRSGVDCSLVAVHNALKRLGCRRKKNRSSPPSGTART